MSPSATEVSGNQRLGRLLSPRSIAIVGASDSSAFARHSRRSFASDADIYLVNPRYDEVFDRPTVPSLSAIGAPVDAVFSLMSAERTVELAQEAVDNGAGGLVTIAGGFSEAGTSGHALQQAMATIARDAGMPVVGPNGVGFINVPRQIELSFLEEFARRPGHTSLVAHSGSVLEAFAASADRAGGVGLNLMISAGNEAVTDLADYVSFLAEDSSTRVIVLAVESIRRPVEFFAAVRSAHEAGKPVVAMKIGRSDRSTRMAKSHTGTLTGDPWVYDVAFEQAGIIQARDVDELVDRVQFLDQLPPERWSAVRGLAILTATGGFASLAADLAVEESVDVPEVDRLKPWIGETIPGAEIPNPLDATGFAFQQRHIWDSIIDTYSAAPEFDALVFLSQFAEWDADVRPLAEQFAAAAEQSPHPFVVSPLAGVPGRWVDEYRSDRVAVGSGLRGCLRGFNTMARFVRRSPDQRVNDPASIEEIPRPDDAPLEVAEGAMLPFATSMQLLVDAGITVAPFAVFDVEDHVTAPSFAGPYVVKLADVAHRTEIGAVRIGVTASNLEVVVAELRALAEEQGVAGAVAVQQRMEVLGEAFVGVRGNSELGPVVAFGIGGTLVEMIRRMSGRLAPFDGSVAESMISEFADLHFFEGFRGGPSWDRDELIRTLVRCGHLAAGARHWMSSLDVNPLVLTPNGVVAVDALCLVEPSRLPKDI